jgi:hypothetical protein
LSNGWTWEITYEWGSRHFLKKSVTVIKNDSSQLMNRIIDIHDGKGNKLSREIFDLEGKLSNREKYSYRAFDQHGNWTERITSRGMGDELEPQEITFREITYRH